MEMIDAPTHLPLTLNTQLGKTWTSSLFCLFFDRVITFIILTIITLFHWIKIDHYCYKWTWLTVAELSIVIWPQRVIMALHFEVHKFTLLHIFHYSIIWLYHSYFGLTQTLGISAWIYMEHNIKQEGPEGPGSLTWGKVKGHSGANNREPQGHNLNNFGRGPFDDVIY